VPGHLLHSGQVHAEVEQVPDPGAAQVVGDGSPDLGLESALATDPPGGGGTEPCQLIPRDQPAGLEGREPADEGRLPLAEEGGTIPRMGRQAKERQRRRAIAMHAGRQSELLEPEEIRDLYNAEWLPCGTLSTARAPRRDRGRSSCAWRIT
jgi:hypothetical protein